VTYKEWSDLLQSSFEKFYYVPIGEHTVAGSRDVS
jgi:hypothetical protein